jgi:hypothetical protein
VPSPRVITAHTNAGRDAERPDSLGDKQDAVVFVAAM